MTYSLYKGAAGFCPQRFFLQKIVKKYKITKEKKIVIKEKLEKMDRILLLNKV